MKIDRVDTVTESIEYGELRRIRVCLEAPCDRFSAAGKSTDAMQQPLAFSIHKPANGIAERSIGRKEIVVDERRCLIRDIVREVRFHAGTIEDVHYVVSGTFGHPPCAQASAIDQNWVNEPSGVPLAVSRKA